MYDYRREDRFVRQLRETLRHESGKATERTEEKIEFNIRLSMIDNHQVHFGSGSILSFGLTARNECQVL